MTTEIVDTLEDVTFPIDTPLVDIPRLRKVVSDLIKGLVGDDFDTWVRTSSGKQAVNLSHHPDVKGIDRYTTMSGGYKDLTDLHMKDIWEHDFTEIPKEINNSYIGTIFKQVGEYHEEKYGTPLKGRHQLVWIMPGSCYEIHVDKHTTYRYHVPIVTHPDVLWIFRQGENLDLVHMPSDGRVWELDPIKSEHTVANFSNVTRLHMIITSV